MHGAGGRKENKKRICQTPWESGSTGMSILCRRAISRAIAARREAQSCFSPLPKSAGRGCSLKCCWQPWWEAAAGSSAATLPAQAAIHPRPHESGCVHNSADPLPLAEFSFCSSWMMDLGMRVLKMQLSREHSCSK